MTPLWETPAPATLPRALRPFVSSMHGYAASGLTPGVHRGLPGRSLTLVLALDAPLAVAPSHDAWVTGDVQAQWSTVGGLHTDPAYVLQPGAWAGIQLDLHPLGARRLLGRPASALPVDQYDARDLLGDVDERLHEHLATATTWAARYAVVVDALTSRLAATDDAPRVRREVVEAWRWLGARRGAGTVTELSDHLGLGRRRLAQLFDGEVGVTPKTAARLMRFEAARRVVGARVVAGEGLDLTELAVAHGVLRPRPPGARVHRVHRAQPDGVGAGRGRKHPSRGTRRAGRVVA